ncbi:methyltransferase [Actinokineospora sp. NBRC 105648]|nr:methyltransferase [Actinokineospora sp. NBRC 105648]
MPDFPDDPLDNALITAFAELVRASGGGPVAEIGCGTGRVTGHLARAGLDVTGIDLSPGMLAIARRDHPTIQFTEGSMLDLDLPDGTLAGVVAWYSIIHMPLDQLPTAFAEFHRVLAPGGHLLLAFHIGDRTKYAISAYGHENVPLEVHHLPIELVCAVAADAGFTIDTQAIRDPFAGVLQGRVLARRG